VTISVNISGRHFSDPRIVSDVATALRTHGVPPQQLILEITETVLVDDLQVVAHFEALRAMGVRIRIDDFGTGYNSVVQLQHLPIDGLKIDRSFVSSTHPAATRLLVVLVQAAHAFDLPVVAEGVETLEQLQTLRSIGCEYAQGYLFARPLPAAAALGYLLDDQLSAKPR
jgi:EAL domain-containing protein (putative c-di-GMP-specific phosphodiesterase class I)